MKKTRNDILPVNLPSFGVGREKAAALFDIGVSLFDRLVENGKMPQPRLLSGRLIWDVSELAEAFKRFEHRRPDLALLSEGDNPWDS